MIRPSGIIILLLIFSLAVTTCTAADAPEYSIGAVIAERHGGSNPFYSYYAVLKVEYKILESYGMETWVYDLLRVHQYPSGSRWYALEGEEITERWQDQMQYDAGYSFFNTGDSVNVNSLPKEPSLLKLPEPKYQRFDIVQIDGYYDSNGDIVHSGGNAGAYSLITGYDASSEGDVGVYYSTEIQKKADGTWGYVIGREYQSDSFWDYKNEFEAGVIRFVTHLPDDKGIEFVDKFPTVVPITTVAPVITTLKPIPIDPPTGVSTLPPTPIRTEGPSSNPFYPVSTPIPTIVTIQPVSPVSVQPVLIAPIAISPTAQPTFGFGKRYAVGNPGSFLGTRFGAGDTTTVTRGSRTITGSDTVLKPGSRSYGLTPPKGQFVRWYPAARWATGIK